MTLSKLQSEAVKELKERFIAPPDSDIGWIVRSDINPIFLETVTNKTLKKKLEQFLSDQIQKAVEETRKETIEIIENLKVKHSINPNSPSRERKIIYNEAIKDVINLCKNK